MTAAVWTLIAMQGATILALFNALGNQRREIAAVRAQFASELGALRAEFSRELGALRAEFTRELGALRAEFTRELGALRAEFTREFTEVRERLSAIESRLDTFDERLAAVEQPR